MKKAGCGQCGRVALLCDQCHNCKHHCRCGAMFDADELGLDPETDNTPKARSRRA